MHRPSNVDHEPTFRNILEALLEIAKEAPIVFPVHPRTMRRIQEFDMGEYFTQASHQNIKQPAIYCVEPLGYLDFLSLMSCARLVLTDSGGIQEETTVLGIPCVTLRENTERPVTITSGTNLLAGTKKKDIVRAALSILNSVSPEVSQKRVPPFWDGKAAQRIVDILTRVSRDETV
jgi:UDP-N-acetylglucosamine 2-epimerase (non-hydrolysing)